MERLVIPIGEKVLEVYSSAGPFDNGIADLKKRRVKISTSEELAEARILDAKVKGGWRDSELCTNGSWTGENYNYHPNGEILIASREFNPILKQLVKATNAHRNNEEFYLSEKLWKTLREHAEADPEKAIESGVLLLPRKNHRFEVPVSSFEEYAPTVFHFRKQAGPYARFLSEQGIDTIRHYIVGEDKVKDKEKPFGRACWLLSLDNRSSFDGLSNDLGYSGGLVRGVRRVPAKRIAPEIPQEIKGLENILLALKEGVAFNHDGLMYVPVRREAIEHAK